MSTTIRTVGQLGHDPAGGLDPVDARHRQVHQHHVGPGPARPRTASPPSAAWPTTSRSSVEREQRGQAGAHHLVVVDEQDAGQSAVGSVMPALGIGGRGTGRITPRQAQPPVGATPGRRGDLQESRPPVAASSASSAGRSGRPAGRSSTRGDVEARPVVGHVEDDLVARRSYRGSTHRDVHGQARRAWRRCAASPARPGRPAVPGPASARALRRRRGRTRISRPGARTVWARSVRAARQTGAGRGSAGRCRPAATAARGCSRAPSRRRCAARRRGRRWPVCLGAGRWHRRRRTRWRRGPGRGRRAARRRSAGARRPGGVDRALEQQLALALVACGRGRAGATPTGRAAPGRAAGCSG